MPKDLQIITCTHSSEIVAAAFAREDCHIYHLESGKLFIKAPREDDDEITEALRNLGSSEAESLLYPLALFVEGASDVEILESGFGNLLRRYQVKDVGGRNEVEKSIKIFQDREQEGKTFTKKFFLFDRDRKPTALSSSNLVKLRQLKRRCIENYLLDEETITECLKEEGVCMNIPISSARVELRLRDLAVQRLKEQVVKDVLHTDPVAALSAVNLEINNRTLGEAAMTIADRLSSAIDLLRNFEPGAWKDDFIKKVVHLESTRSSNWNMEWRELCDGKQLFVDLRQEYKLRIKLDNFKLKIIRGMKAQEKQLWRQLRDEITSLLQA